MQDYIRTILTQNLKIKRGELFTKFWISKISNQFYFRPIAINKTPVNNIIGDYKYVYNDYPKRNFEDTVLFKILKKFNFKNKGIVVLPGYQQLRQRILSNIDIDSLIFTDSDEYFQDTHFKSYIQNFEHLEDKIHQDFDLYVFDFTKTIDYNLIQLPFRLMISKNISVLPYIIIFTRLLSCDDYNKLTRMFGTIQLPKYRFPELKLFDYRLTQQDRGEYDENYIPLDEQEILKYYVDNISENQKFKIGIDRKLLIITSDIDYAGIEFVRLLNKQGIVIKTLNKHNRSNIYKFDSTQIPDYYYEVEEIDEEERAQYDLDEICSNEFVTYDVLKNIINNISIVVIDKDDFSELDLSQFEFRFIINTEFQWDINSRMDFIVSIYNCKCKLLMVYSPTIPSNLKPGIKEHEKKLLYNVQYEQELFEAFNIIQLYGL